MAVKTNDTKTVKLSNFTESGIKVDAKGKNAIRIDGLAKADVKNLSMLIEGKNLVLYYGNKRLIVSNYSGIKYIKTDYKKSGKKVTYNLTDIISSEYVINTANIPYNKTKKAYVGTKYNDTFTTNPMKNDTFTGGLGKNTFNYSHGGGKDTINLTNTEDLTINLTDISSEEISFGYANSKKDLVIYTNAEKTESITLKNYGAKNVVGSKGSVIIKTTDNEEGINLKNNPILNNVKSHFTGTWLKDVIDASGVTKQPTKTVTKTVKGKKVKQTVETPVSLNGGSGNDLIIGSNFKDSINGGAGNDTITATVGNDTIVGGKGTNVINYTYDVEHTNFGKDVIKLTKGETLNLNITGDDVSLDFAHGTGKNKNDLIITNNKNSENKITIKDYYGKELGATVLINGRDYSKQLAESPAFFFDNTKVSSNKINGSALADLVYAFDADKQYKTVTKTVNGKKKKVKVLTNLTINSGGGNDSVMGSKYNDSIIGGSGNDTLSGISGNDTIKGGNGNDSILGGEGNDKLYGGAGNDTIYGDSGNDTIYGDAGNDTFLFSAGSGKDTVYADKGKDTIKFDNSVLASNIKFKKSGKYDLIINYGYDESGKPTDSITIKNYYNKKGKIVSSVKNIEIAGRTFNLETFRSYTTKYNIGNCTEGNDMIILSGSNSHEINAKGGNDLIYASNNTIDNLIYGGDGDDTIYASEIETNVGQGSYYTGNGNNTVYLSDNNTSNVYLGNGDDNVYLGKHYSTVDIIGSGFKDGGNDTIHWSGGNDPQRLYFNSNLYTGYKLSDLSFTRAEGSDDLVIRYGNNNSVTLKDYYKQGNENMANMQISVLKPEGSNTDWHTLAQAIELKGMTSYISSSGEISGTENADYIIGSTGADTISSGAGNDTIIGGGGDDVINSNGGDDIIYLGSGDSTVKIDMSMFGETEWSTPEYPSYIENCTKTIYLNDDTTSTLTLDFDKTIFDNGYGVFCRATGQDRDLYISMSNSTDPAYGIVVKNYFDENGNPRTNQVKLSIWEGEETPTIYTVAEYATATEIPWVRVFDVQPFGPYEGEIHGTNMPNETLLYSAGFGDDTIYGGNGNRELICLHGGHDIVHSNEGTKNVSIWGNQTNVELYLGSEETTKTNINLGLVEGNVTSSINDAGDLLVSWGCYANNANDPYVYTSNLRVDNWNSRTSQATFSIIGNDRDNTLNAIDGVANTIDGREGDDVLIGGTGVDTFSFTYNNGYGIDTVRNYTSDDILRFESASSYGVDFTKFKYYTNDNGKNLVINTKDLEGKDSYVIIDNYFESDNKIDTVTTYNWSSPDETKSLATMYGNVDDMGSFDLGTGGEYSGTDKEDIFVAKSGANTYEGGEGVDALHARGGESTFVFNAGDGSDIVYQEGGTITLKFNDATIEELTSKTGYDKGDGHTNGFDDLLIHYDGENTLIVKDFYWTSHNHAVKIIDSTGTEYNMTDCFKNVKNINSISDFNMYPATNKDDDIRILSDTTGVTQIAGKKGSDRIWGSNADEEIFSHNYGYTSSAYDTTPGVVDEIHAGGGDDWIFAWSDTNIVYGDAGDDTIFVNVGQKSIVSDSSGTADALSINPVDGSDIADYDKTHFVFNVNSDGVVDDAGLRILTAEEYDLWKADTNNAAIRGINIVKDSQGNGGYNCIEAFIDANDHELAMSAIEAVKGEITSWLSTNSYGSVAGVFTNALGKSAEDSAADIAVIVAKFDSIQTMWS